MFFARARAGLGTEGVRAPLSVGQSLTLSRPRACDGGVGVCVCLCVRALLHARPQLRHGRRWRIQHGEGKVSPPPQLGRAG